MKRFRVRTMAEYEDHRHSRIDDAFRLRESKEHGGEVVARLDTGENVYAATYAALIQLLSTRAEASVHNADLEEIPCFDECRLN